MNLVNVTGTHPLVPACPQHKSVALIPEPRHGNGGKLVNGFWRCPQDDRVYIDQPLNTPNV